MDNEFKKVYEEIQKHKIELEKLRIPANKAAVEGGKKIMNFLFICVVAPMILFLVMLIIFSLENEAIMNILSTILSICSNKFVILIAFFVLLLSFVKSSKKMGDIQLKYHDAYKKLVVEPIIKLVGENLEYHPNEGLLKTLYNEANFGGNYSSYESSNLILGKYKNYDLNWAFCKTTYESDEGRCVDFEGVVVCCNCIKKIDTNLKIVFNVLEKGDSYEKNMKKITLENIHFENYFNIYGDDEIKALQYITADVMEKLVEFRKKYGYQFDISIYANKVYVRFKNINGSFRPPYDLYATNLTDTKNIYNVLNRTIFISRYLAKTLNEKANLI